MNWLPLFLNPRILRYNFIVTYSDPNPKGLIPNVRRRGHVLALCNRTALTISPICFCFDKLILGKVGGSKYEEEKESPVRWHTNLEPEILQHC